jgi:GDPmannose 4,6-dehydratase
VKRALVFGSAGQDGRILTQQLLGRGMAVAGVDRGGVTLEGSEPASRLPSTDLLKRAEVERLIAHFQPDYAFYLAAFHHSSEQAFEEDLAELFRESFAVNVEGWVHVLEALRRHVPKARAFYAASSHVFGAPAAPIQNEQTPFSPNNAYGITKASAVQVGRFFRARGQHVSTGILYNHESALRPEHFVSQRIVRGAIEAAEAKKIGAESMLELGSLAAVVDWGYAPDYTDAMLRIVSHDEPDEYVVATGVPHTVAEFCEAAFRAVGLDWCPYVSERPGRVTKVLAPLVGDATKLRQTTGWAPTVTFENMVQLLVEAARPGATP